MKKTSIILLMSVIAIVAGSGLTYAHEGVHHPTVKAAVRELQEAQEILGKISPDADGHVAKASQAVDQAMQELSAVKTEPKKS